MRRRGMPRLLTAAAVLAAALAATGSAAAQQGASPSIVVQDGVTQPVFGYADAIRERVWVEADFDTDQDGVKDRIALDIMRPAATATGYKAPVIMDASPYYSTLGRGNESEFKEDTDGDGLLDKWPLFYDNYFVPRGYAVVLLDMVGTNNSTGCPVTGGTPDHLSAVVGIDWLNGRRKGYDEDGNEVVAVVAQRQDRDDRQVVRRDARERRGIDRRRGARDDRADLGHLVLVRLHPVERRGHAREQLSVGPLEHRHEP